MKETTFVIGLVLGFFAFIAFFYRVVVKVMQGDGLEYYFSVLGYQFNYLGALILLVLIPLVLVIALLVRRFQLRHEKDFKDKYLD